MNCSYGFFLRRHKKGIIVGLMQGAGSQHCLAVNALRHLGAPTLAWKHRHSHTNGLMDTRSGTPCLFLLLHMAFEQSSVMANGLPLCARQVKQQHAALIPLQPVTKEIRFIINPISTEIEGATFTFSAATSSLI